MSYEKEYNDARSVFQESGITLQAYVASRKRDDGIEEMETTDVFEARDKSIRLFCEKFGRADLIDVFCGDPKATFESVVIELAVLKTGFSKEDFERMAREAIR